jgi:hypothetical protein
LLPAAAVPSLAGAATITPTGGFFSDNFTNDSNCSVREAISVANQDGSTSEDSCGVAGTLGDDTIVLGPGPYALTLGPPGEDSNAGGDLDAKTDATAGDLTIQGAGGSSTTLNATGLGDRVLHNPAVDASNTLTVSGLKLTGALIPGQFGGGLLHINAGNVALNGVIVSGNTAGTGAGIAFSGPGTSSLSLTNTTVGPNNNGTVGGGGIFASGAAVTLTESDVTSNLAPVGGGIQLVSGASLVANGATTEIKQNTATVQGGGIQAGSGNVTLNAGVHLSSNQINDANGGFGAGLQNNQGPGGGDLTLNGATVSNNTIAASDPTGDADGAGIRYLADGTVTLNDAAVISNSGSAGDGIGGGLSVSSGATLMADSSLIAGNSLTLADNALSVVEGGGGIGVGSGATATLVRTTVDSNHLIQNDPQDTVGGGGIFSVGDTLTLDSSTVSDNDLGGSPLARNGAGILGTAGDIKLVNSTVAANAGGTSSSGGGIAYETTSADTLTIAHSTVATNTATTAPGIFRSLSGTIILRGSIIDQGATGCVGGSITANAFNVDRGTTCVGGANDTDLESTNPLLGVLADHGGATDTFVLPLGSPAVNAVTANCLNLGGTALLADQRGYPRPFPSAGACDAGSYELFTCDGVAQNPPGPFAGCPAPPTPGTGPTGTQPPTTTMRKKCKKKHKHRASAAKKCKRKKRR